MHFTKQIKIAGSKLKKKKKKKKKKFSPDNPPFFTINYVGTGSVQYIV